MKNIVPNIPAYLLGFIFLVFGLNGFLHFIPLPPMTGNAATFIGVLVSTGFLALVKALEVIYGGLILANIQRPLAAVLLAPISVCILLFELLIANAPGIGILLVALNAYVIYQNKDKYMGMLK